MRFNKKGFTLIELLVVIAIIAIMSAMAIPYMADWISRADYRNASRQVLQVLKQGRSLAISKNREYRVEFDLDSSDATYLYRISEGDLSASNTHTLLGWTVIDTWADSSIPASVALRGTSACNSVAESINLDDFIFHPNGSFTSNGNHVPNYICIMDVADLIPANWKYRVGIVNSNTGRVVIE